MAPNTQPVFWYLGLDLSARGAGAALVSRDLKRYYSTRVGYSVKQGAPLMERIVRAYDVACAINSFIAKVVNVPDGTDGTITRGMFETAQWQAPLATGNDIFNVQQEVLSMLIHGGRSDEATPWFRLFDPPIGVTPSEVKKYHCGKGNANNMFLLSHLTNRYGIVAPSEDEAVAYALATMARESLHEVENLRKDQQKILKNVRDRAVTFRG